MATFTISLRDQEEMMGERKKVVKKAVSALMKKRPEKGDDFGRRDHRVEDLYRLGGAG